MSPRGTRKRGEFDFTIWLEDGARLNWKSSRAQTNIDIAATIRRYLLPVAARLESHPEHNAVDPHVADPGTPSPRDGESS